MVWGLTVLTSMEWATAISLLVLPSARRRRTRNSLEVRRVRRSGVVGGSGLTGLAAVVSVIGTDVSGEGAGWWLLTSVWGDRLSRRPVARKETAIRERK